MENQDTQHFAKLRFGIPDLSVSPEDRALYGFPANKEVIQERVKLHDFRTSSEVTKGPEGLDVQGFTYINHRSALNNSDQRFTEEDVRKTFIPEVEDLICKVTGAKRAVANNIAFRRKLATEQEDPKFYYKKDHPLDQALSKFPRDIAIGRKT
jgi:GA4 desaturase